MSKAFTKEDAGESLVIPSRAPLPEGVPNYVTGRGLALLRQELEALEAERAAAASAPAGDERARKLSVLDARVAETGGRLRSATVVDTHAQPHDEVHFGATVELRTESGALKRLQIVGVDEADAAHGRVAFVAPIARALMGRRAGDSATLRTGRGDEELEIVTISYEPA